MQDSKNLQEFMSLFQGYEKAHVQFREGPEAGKGEKQSGKYMTVEKPATTAEFNAHLHGDGPGLVIIPLMQDNNCCFGAIDIDERGMDIHALDMEVRRLGLPLVTCRSKSAGAHLYMFLKQPTPATKVREALSNWAVVLGHSKAEIFPKQTSRDLTPVGSGINLPYYGGPRTARYAIGEGKSLSIAGFMALAEGLKASPEDLKKRFSAIPQKTSVVKKSHSAGFAALDIIPEGQRHNEIMRLGVQLKKQGYDDDVIRAVLKQAAEKRCDPPLSQDEVDDVCGWVSENVTRGHEMHPLTDMGNARRFADRYAGEVVHCCLWNQYLIWDGCRYLHDDLGKSILYAKMTALSISDEAIAYAAQGNNGNEVHNFAKQSQNRKRLVDMLWAAQSELAVHPDDLDKDPLLLNVQNGVIDLRSGELLPSNPALLLTKMAPVTYSPGECCPNFMGYLDKVFGGNTDLIKYMQRVMGYCLTGHTSEHCIRG